MKNFATLILMVYLVQSKDLLTDREDIEKQPDLSGFPKDWTHNTCSSKRTDSESIDRKKCEPVDRDIREVARYDEELMADYEDCINNRCRPRRATCEMKYNPAHPTTMPHGIFHLW
jgi:hypothetical protein